MGIDSSFYDECIKIFDVNIGKIFGEEARKISEEKNYAHMGYFKLTYENMPNDFTIEIENEIRTFSIKIIDKEGASNDFYRITKIDCKLDEEKIINALNYLRELLISENFDLYIFEEDKVYRKNSEGINRVKDLKELM